MPPPIATPANLLIAAVTAFRNLVNNIQGTEDPGQQLRQTATSLGEVANVLDKLAASAVAQEQHNDQVNQRLGQTVQQMQDLQQQTVQQVRDLQQRANSMQTTADEAKSIAQTATTSSSPSSVNRKPLCESRSVANLKTLGFKKGDFEKLERKTNKRHYPSVRTEMA